MFGVAKTFVVMWINLSFLLKFIAGCVLWLLCRASALHPIIRHYAEPDAVKVCGNSTLFCEVLTPNAKVWWTHNGSAIDSTGSPNATTHEEYENITLWKLQISCAQLRDMGNYTCNVKTINSSVHYSKNVFFRVIDPLSIESSPFVLSELGHTVKVNCSVMGNDLPESIKWIKNGSRLESRGNINISQRVISVSKITSYLEILNLTEANFGTYTCLASTNFDTVSANTTVFNKALHQPRNISVKPLDVSVVQVKWIGTPSNIPVDKYEIKVTNEDGSENIIVATAQNHKPGLHFYDHKIKKLPPFTTVKFQIRACSNEFGCGDFSENNEVTLPGYSSPPLNVTLTCHYDNISFGNYIHATWESPKTPKGTIKSYQFKLEGKANYLDNFGKYITSSPKITTEETYENSIKIHVDANTNYTIIVCAINDVGCGSFSEATIESTCSTSPGVPRDIPEFELKCDDLSENCQQLRLEMKRISERYGPIKCYRVVLYKMKFWKEDIPKIDLIALSSYTEVHKDGGFGAYIAESFDREKFPLEVTLGDASQSRCHEVIKRQKRTLQPVEDIEGEVVYDGELSADTYYSGFVEVKVIGKDEAILTKRSSLFMPIRTGYLKYSLQATALGVICGLLIVIIILAVALCALSKRNNVPEYERNYSLCGIVCSPCRGFAARGTAGTPVLPPPDIKPLKPENLPAAFIERHKDSDLLFQREFEALPEQFRDRTTRASDMLENFFKNRYPDIKAYDQTRVKLSTIDGIAGSDYINANYVMGYKERKKFICAQGPLDRTVNDFWRMIWEQKVEIVVMVTCLEENGKMKCTKYWPEDEEKKYGNITVSLKV